MSTVPYSPSPLDRWAWRGALCAVLSVAAALIWLAWSMGRPALAASNVSTKVADEASARSKP